MKLFVQYTRINFVAVLLVLLVASLCYYFLIRFVLIDQLDDSLRVEEQEILDNLHRKGTLPESTQYRDQQIRVSDTTLLFRRQFISDRAIGRFGKMRRIRRLIFPVSVRGGLYAVSVSKSQQEADELLGWIGLVTGGVVLLLFLALFLVNRLMVRRLWRPFYRILESVRQFTLAGRRSIAPVETSIDEFADLERSMQQMTARVLQDYESLKNFTENASHEMQTPLAIINSRLDLLIQDRHLEESQMKQLQIIYDATGRLTKLNQSLLLLTKIENNQFDRLVEVRLDRLIGDKMAQLEDLVSAKQLGLTVNTVPVSLEMDEYLAEILLGNLLNNAVRHNLAGGRIAVDLVHGGLRISNTYYPLGFDSSGIFDRFQKGDRSQGTGLGLAIVKQICDRYRFGIQYAYMEGQHVFTLSF